MKMPCCSNHSASTVLAMTSAALLSMLPTGVLGQEKKANPASKVYVSDVNGEAQIDTGETIQDLAKRSVYNAQGTVIETKKNEKESDQGKISSSMVYSNGTGAFFDQDTRVEVKRFVQEPFTPNRADMDVEPSISQTQAFVARGTVGLCTSKLVAGSSMVYQTSQGQVNIRGRKVVIEANNGMTKISMLEGESTVRGGSADLGGQTLRAGEQAIIRQGAAGASNRIQIQKIPPAEAPLLDDKVSQACMAKKTVYFEVKEREFGLGRNEISATTSTNAAQPEGTKTDGDTTPVASSEGARISAFDGNSAPSASQTQTVGQGVIIAVPVVPTELPVRFTVSPARVGGG